MKDRPVLDCIGSCRRCDALRTAHCTYIGAATRNEMNSAPPPPYAVALLHVYNHIPTQRHVVLSLMLGQVGTWSGVMQELPSGSGDPQEKDGRQALPEEQSALLVQPAAADEQRHSTASTCSPAWRGLTAHIAALRG